LISILREKQLSKNDELELIIDNIAWKADNPVKSPTNRVTYSTGRKRRPLSKTHKRTTTSIPKKKRDSRTNSTRREDILKQYLGHTINHDSL